MPCPCPVCTAQTQRLGALDFNKCCHKEIQPLFPVTGLAITYEMCPSCGYAFAPQFLDWSEEDFLTKIYNQDYITLDPAYKETRPRHYAGYAHNLFPKGCGIARHLDYGGGSGLLSELMKEKGWNSQTFDPFPQTEARLEDLGTFDYITAIEVFEHVPDVNVLMKNLCHLLEKPGLIFFTTLASDNQILCGKKLDWWYAAPRNGHVSLFSHKSLTILAQRYGLLYKHLDNIFHLFFREVPTWATRSERTGLGAIKSS